MHSLFVAMRPAHFTLLFAFACSSQPTDRLTNGAVTVDTPLESDETPQPAPTTRPNPFAKAPPYKSDPPAERAKDVHAQNGVSVVPSKDVQCLGCHAKGAAPKFLFGGTIYDDRDGTAPAKDMELGIVDANGKTFFAHSDDDGNFWVTGASTLAYPVYAAVRMETTTKPMKTKISDASKLECNSCHNKLNPIQKP